MPMLDAENLSPAALQNLSDGELSRLKRSLNLRGQA